MESAAEEPHLRTARDFEVENQLSTGVPLDRPLDLGAFTPRLLALLTNVISSRESQGLRRSMGFGTTDWRILASLAQEPALTATELSQYTAMSKAVISRALTGLVQQGVVAQGEGPRGSRPLRLTEAGITVYRRMLPIAYRSQRLIERTLSQEELVALEALLRRCLDASILENNWHE